MTLFCLLLALIILITYILQAKNDIMTLNLRKTTVIWCNLCFLCLFYPKQLVI